MSQWKPMPDAARQDADGRPIPVRLFLPGHKYRMVEGNRAADIEHGECIGVWDAAQSHWIDRDTGHKVYPSQWQLL